MKSRAMGTSIGTEHSKNKSVNANTQSVPATECRTNNNNNVRIQQGNKVRTTFRSLRDPSSQPLLAQEPSWAKQEANTALPQLYPNRASSGSRSKKETKKWIATARTRTTSTAHDRAIRERRASPSWPETVGEGHTRARQTKLQVQVRYQQDKERQKANEKMLSK